VPENLEIKAPLESFDAAVRAAQGLHAEDCGELHQSDTYFVVPRGRLKLRAQGPPGNAGQHLIFYHRDEESAVRLSNYDICPVGAGSGLGPMLVNALGLLGEVHKRRRLFLHKSTRIHIDNVEGLGAFLELETPLTGNRADGSAEISFLMDHFGITEKNCISVSYIDLLLKNSSAKNA
jgi:adenylate cyclase class IV